MPRVAFLLNGGEEMYMNAVHGFVEDHHYHGNGISVDGGGSGVKDKYWGFVNLEATGSFGPDVVFRANSETLLGAYVNKAPRPR